MITENRRTLRQFSSPFKGTKEDLDNIFSCLEFELETHPLKGCGLSGIQISYPYKVCIIRSEGLKLNLYNAEIVSKIQPFIFKGEGCLSVPGVHCDTQRYNLIEVKNGDGKILKFSGFQAVIIQHEIEHWEGKLFLDVSHKEVSNDKVDPNNSSHTINLV